MKVVKKGGSPTPSVTAEISDRSNKIKSLSQDQNDPGKPEAVASGVQLITALLISAVRNFTKFLSPAVVVIGALKREGVPVLNTTTVG